MKTYEDFKEAVGKRESGGDYQIKNSLGYLGKYQFGLARLSDFGLCERKPNTKGYGNKSFDWVPPFAEDIFLTNEELQDTVFDKHVWSLRRSIEKGFSKYLDTEISGHKLTLSGAIGCCHLLGVGGLKDFISGKDSQDAYGTKASDYVELFKDYEILTNPNIEDIKTLV